MRLYAASLLILASIICWVDNVKLVKPSVHTTYGYLQKYGIPRAEQIHMAEKKLNDSKIIGGVPACVGQYPFQVGLIGDIIGLDDRSVCGGSLLTPSRVVTAAHCWSDGIVQVWRFTVILGSIYFFSGGTRIETSAVAPHPNWSPILARNDIAVIYLPNAVTLSSIISTVALPTSSQASENFASESAVAVGFGITADGGAISTDQTLNHVRLNVITNNVCSLAFPFLLQESHLCTSGFGGVSVCSGDSGGPLLITRDGHHVLIGIASFVSTLGCETYMPAAFTRVTFYLDFIHSHIK